MALPARIEAALSSTLSPAAFPAISRVEPLPLGLPALDEALPDGGLPRGAVVEISSAGGLARATSIALAACASAQREARCRGVVGTEGAWCAWIDPGANLNAPGVAESGVDLSRLLVVRPPITLGPTGLPRAEGLARVAIRVAESAAFAVVVVDAAGLVGDAGGRDAPRAASYRWDTVVRRLSLAMERSEATLLLLTDQAAPRAVPLPVAMRLELTRRARDRMTLRVAKERRGRVTGAISVALPWSTPVLPSERAEERALLGA